MGGTGAERGGRCTRQIEYSALPSQARFHQSTARFKGFSGPIGSGKSQALCHEAIRLAYLNAGRLGLLGAPTYPMLRDATQTTLFEILERNRIPYEHNKAENTAGAEGHTIADTLPADGGVRPAARDEPRVVRAGRTDLHAGRSLGGAGRAAARSEGEAALRVRGVDAEGVRLGLPAVRTRASGRLRSHRGRSRSRTGTCSNGFRTFTSG